MSLSVPISLSSLVSEANARIFLDGLTVNGVHDLERPVNHV